MLLQAAPADRDAGVDWTTMQTVVIEGGNLSMNVDVRK